MDKVVDFIKKEILPLQVVEEGGTLTAAQTLRQMDGLLTKIDQEIASFEPGQKRFAHSLLVQLRQAVQLDMVGNIRGTSADVIRAELKATDETFSHVMSQLFETAEANRFASIQKKGLRAVGIKKTTRTPLDQLSRAVVKLDSPQAIDELARLVSPETMQRITATTIDDAVTLSQTKRGFNPDRLAKTLGLDNLNSPRAQSLAKMLEHSGNPLTIKELANFTEAARVISNLEIPNVSTFIARRATIGGVRALLSGLIPGLALSGAVAWSAGSLAGAITFIGGSRLISAVMSNPTSARALKHVLDKEATTVVRRAAYLRALRFGIRSLSDSGEITGQERHTMEQAATLFMLEMNAQVKELSEALN